MVVADSSRATGMQFLVQTGKDRWSLADVSSIATGVHGLALKARFEDYQIEYLNPLNM